MKSSALLLMEKFHPKLLFSHLREFLQLKWLERLVPKQLGLVSLKWVSCLFGVYSTIKSGAFLHKDLREVWLKIKQGLKERFPRTLKGMSDFIVTSAEPGIDSKLEEIKSLIKANKCECVGVKKDGTGLGLLIRRTRELDLGMQVGGICGNQLIWLAYFLYLIYNKFF